MDLYVRNTRRGETNKQSSRRCRGYLLLLLLRGKIDGVEYSGHARCNGIGLGWLILEQGYKYIYIHHRYTIILVEFGE
jgi:hypothetical protein